MARSSEKLIGARMASAPEGSLFSALVPVAEESGTIAYLTTPVAAFR
jgi:hypothetical protein